MNTVEPAAPAPTRAAIAAGPFRRSASTEPDRLGMFLLGAAVLAAPLEIWSLATVASRGVTLSHLVAVVLSILAVVRFRRMPLAAGFALYCLVAVVIWGVIVAFLQAGVVPSLARTARVAVLFALMFGAFAGASTVRLDLSGRSAGVWIAVCAYVLVVLYAMYQTVARRMMWPLAFLRITNPTYSTDPVYVGMQHGISAAEQGWGAYFVRAAATFSEPSHLGCYLAYGFAVSIALIPLGRRAARWGVVGIVVSLAGLIANYSLNGILSYGVVAVAMAPAILRHVGFKTSLRLAVLAGVLLGGTLLFVPSIRESVAERLSSLSVEESSGRFSSLPMVIAEVKERPWGVGLAGVDYGNEVHNAFMLFALQFGVFGAVVPFVWIGALIFCHAILFLRARRLSPATRTILLASTGMIAAQFAAWIGGAAFHLPYAWIMSGAAFGALGRAFGRTDAGVSNLDLRTLPGEKRVVTA